MQSIQHLFIFYLRYVELNVKCHDSYRAYNKDLPKFLHNRPEKMVSHIMKRWETDIADDMVKWCPQGSLMLIVQPEDTSIQ